MYDVYCVSAGQLDVKKDANIINKRNMYLNYGLLSLTSIINKTGLKSILLHGHFTHPREFAEYCLKLGIAKTKYPIFISMPSFYALNWVVEFTKILKTEIKIKEIVVGGRWVIDGESNKLSKLLPYVDSIVDGLGENKISKFINKPVGVIKGYTPLNYELVDKRSFYQPSIEVSRGCGMKCAFCQERDEKLQPLKSPLKLITEVNDVLICDDMVEMTPYFEASMFKPDLNWLNHLFEQRELHSNLFKWRAESRVDTLSLKLIPMMAKAGMKVLDLGLESASPKQIKSMGKSISPEKYLNRASNLLNTAYEFGIDVKVNVLLYAGESKSTIDETYKWLDRHRQFIKGVSIGPVIAFGWDENKVDFINSLKSCGAQVCDDSSSIGITNFHLSKSINRKKSLAISKELSRDFMTAEDYYYLKSFSYFPRNYMFSDFIHDIETEKGDYSFKVEDSVALTRQSR